MMKNLTTKNNLNSLKLTIMKTKKTILFSLASITALGLMSFSILYNDGEAGFTGSPADGGATCYSCHSDNILNSGNGSVTIGSNPAFTGNLYQAGTAYTISVTVTKPGQVASGFGFEALKTPANTQTGTFTPGAGTATMGASPVNMVQSVPGGGPTHTFTFTWTAPIVGTGPVTLYAVGNSTDGNGTGGDFVYTTSLALTECPVCRIDNNTTSNSEIIVYPNPASENISIKNAASENLHVVMYDLSGKEAMNSGNISAQNNNISLENIADGTYILKVYTENGLLKSDKIIVMHK